MQHLAADSSAGQQQKLCLNAWRAARGWAGLAAHSYASCFSKLTHRRAGGRWGWRSAYLSHWSQDMRLMQTISTAYKGEEHTWHALSRTGWGGREKKNHWVKTLWEAYTVMTAIDYWKSPWRPAVILWLLKYHIWPCRPYKGPWQFKRKQAQKEGDGRQVAGRRRGLGGEKWKERVGHLQLLKRDKPLKRLSVNWLDFILVQIAGRRDNR